MLDLCSKTGDVVHKLVKDGVVDGVVIRRNCVCCVVRSVHWCGVVVVVVSWT